LMRVARFSKMSKSFVRMMAFSKALQKPYAVNDAERAVFLNV